MHTETETHTWSVNVPDHPQESVGVHHYPTPVVDIQLFKYDDFELWVTDSEGNPAAVTPVGALILPVDHPLAQQAFQNQ